MTTLAIIPNWKNKSARFKGTVAAGEHVSVTIQNDNGEGEKVIDDASTLRLRVVGMDGRTLAIFPEPVEEGETPEAWGEADLTPLTCTLNLNTVQMLKAVPPAANVPLLWVLDDYENKTLYFKEQFSVEHWPRKFGEEEPTPTDLDDYEDIIEDFNTRLTAAEQTVATAATDAQAAAVSASAAADSASAAATAATDAQTGAIASKNAAQTAADNAAGAKIAAETAQGKAEEAQEAAETAQGKAEDAAEAAAESAAAFVVDDTLSVEGAAADAKAAGDANQDLITRIETVQDNLDNEVAAREELDGAVQVDRQNLAEEIARAQGAEQTLDATKADRATTYTKTEVDTKIGGFVDGAEYDSTAKKILLKHDTTTVAEIDATDFIKDGMVSSVEIEDGKLIITFNTDAGLEPIEIPLTDIFDPSNYYDKDAVDNLLDGKQPRLTPASATILGGIKTVWAEVKQQGLVVLLRLPTENFTINGKALSSDVTLTGADIAVSGTDATKIDAALAGKASKADATLTERGFTEWAWEGTPPTYEGKEVVLRLENYPFALDDIGKCWVAYTVDGEQCGPNGDPTARDDNNTKTTVTVQVGGSGYRTAIRTALQGYQLGSQRDKLLASEAEAEALRTGKQNALSQTQLDNIAAVPNKLDKSGGTMTGILSVPELDIVSGSEIVGIFPKYMYITGTGFIDFPSTSGTLALTAPNPTEGNLAALDANGNPTDSGVKASDKLDSTSAAPAFSTDSSVSYPVDSRVTYNGKLYKCTTATTGGTWDASKWTADTMTDPDAVLDITAQNQLRVVAKDGTLLWAQGYDLASTSSATLACDAANNFTFADGATTQAFALPTAPTGKVGDFGLDIDNSANTRAATISFSNVANNTASVIIPKGENLNDMLAIAAGELARFYISLSTFRVNNLPTWHILKQVVENGGATV